MTAAVYADELPVRLVRSLARTGRTATALTSIQGPAMTRWSLVTSTGEYLWVDLPAKDSAPRSTSARYAVGSGRSELDELVEPDGRVQLGAPLLLPGVGVAHCTPWPARLLADLLTGGGQPADDQLGWAVGRALRRLHGSADSAAPLQPAGRTGGGGRALAPRCPAALRRVLELVDASIARTDQQLADALERVLADWNQTTHVRLHGEPSSGHLLVQAQALGGEPAPATDVLAVLIGWAAPTYGPAWFDVGYLLGDLLELAELAVSFESTGAAVALARAVRTGYDGADPLPGPFWRSAADAAVVKVLDHDARIQASFGPQPQAVPFLTRAARSMLDPGRLTEFWA